MNNLNHLRNRSTKIFNSIKTYSQRAAEKINRPQRIERSPTDILKVLATTIKADPTAGHYKYHDDPYLIPATQIGKRTFALAKESGRKSAQWIRQEHPELFQHRIAAPDIECFHPKAIYNEESNLSEDILNNIIDQFDISGSVNAYKILLKKGTEISYETKLRLLQLVCFYNSQDPLSEDLVEERWYQTVTKGKEKFKKTWNDNGFAEELFSSLQETADSRAYCTLLLGRARYMQIDKSYELYKEMVNKGLELNIECYNAVLLMTNFINEDPEFRFRHIQETLAIISNKKIKPNLLTLNSTLDALINIGSASRAKPFAKDLLAEFKELGIEPSLATYHHLLNLFYKNRNYTNSETFEAVLSTIENQEFTIQDIKDTQFFLSAMFICRYNLQKKELAYRVHNLFQLGKNCNFMGNSLNESTYYRNLFIVLCNTESLDKFMEFYDYHVPNFYIPEPVLMEEILYIIELRGEAKYLLRIWKDIIAFDHINRQPIVEAVLNVIAAVHKVPGSFELNDLSTIVDQVWEKFIKDQEHDGKINRLFLTGSMVSTMINILLNNDGYEKAKEIFYATTLNNKYNFLMHGSIDTDVLKMFIDKAVFNKNNNLALDCIQYALENGYSSANDLVNYLKESKCLTNTEMDKLEILINS